LANSTLDQEPISAFTYTQDKSSSQDPINNIVNFSRKQANPQADLSKGKKNIVNFSRKNSTSNKIENDKGSLEESR
jgi:hypothetical protein